MNREDTVQVALGLKFVCSACRKLLYIRVQRSVTYYGDPICCSCYYGHLSLCYDIYIT